MKEPDLIAFLKRQPPLPEIAIEDLRTGDALFVQSQNTGYCFKMTREARAELTTGRKDRPSGPVEIIGTTYGGSSIKPGILFCGGHLEFQWTRHDGESMTHTTTPIAEIRHLRKTDFK